MYDQKALKAAIAIRNAMYKNPAWHVGRHSDGTPALDIDMMNRELEGGLIDGWLGIKEVEACTLSQWSCAMDWLISQERNAHCDSDRFDYTNKYDR
jgi:hypothetical protein